MKLFRNRFLVSSGYYDTHKNFNNCILELVINPCYDDGIFCHQLCIIFQPLQILIPLFVLTCFSSTDILHSCTNSSHRVTCWASFRDNELFISSGLIIMKYADPQENDWERTYRWDNPLFCSIPVISYKVVVSRYIVCITHVHTPWLILRSSTNCWVTHAGEDYELVKYSLTEACLWFLYRRPKPVIKAINIQQFL